MFSSSKKDFALNHAFRVPSFNPIKVRSESRKNSGKHSMGRIFKLQIALIDPELDKKYQSKFTMRGQSVCYFSIFNNSRVQVIH